MKTNLFILFTICYVLGIGAAHAQGADQPLISVKIYGGYSLFTPGSTQHGTNFDEVNDHYSQSRLGSGAGFNYGVGLTAPLGKLWIAGLDAGYLAGSKASFSETITLGGQTINDNYYTKTSFLSITPHIAYKLYNAKDYFVYTKAGIIIATGIKSNYHYYDIDQTSDLTNTSGQDIIYKYGVNFGFQSGAGIQFKLTKRLSGFCELTGNFLTLKPESYNSVINFVTPQEDIVYTNFIDQVTYLNKKSGILKPFTTTTTTNGNTKTTENYYELSGIKQHVNNMVINAGLVYGFK